MTSAALSHERPYTEEQKVWLADCARRYIWWQAPEDSLESPERIILQVMEIGEAEHMLVMPDIFERRVLLDILKSANAGILSPQSWSYWHFRLGWPPDTDVPPLHSARRVS